VKVYIVRAETEERDVQKQKAEDDNTQDPPHHHHQEQAAESKKIAVEFAIRKQI
jgi:hypothetical protein